MSEAPKHEAVAEARRLLRGARVGTLATSATGGQPFASLVTPACAPDLSVLLLLSNLSEHTRHLRADPRCALLVAGPPETANPQTAPRLTVTGEAMRADDPALKARWLALHPYAACTRISRISASGGVGSAAASRSAASRRRPSWPRICSFLTRARWRRSQPPRHRSSRIATTTMRMRSASSPRRTAAVAPVCGAWWPLMSMAVISGRAKSCSGSLGPARRRRLGRPARARGAGRDGAAGASSRRGKVSSSDLLLDRAAGAPVKPCRRN